MQRNTIKLTRKTAQAIVKQELGISGAALVREDTPSFMQRYTMKLGVLEVTVDNGAYENNGCFLLKLAHNFQGELRIYIDPKTLAENDEAGDRYRAECRREMCECCFKGA